MRAMSRRWSRAAVLASVGALVATLTGIVPAALVPASLGGEALAATTTPTGMIAWGGTYLNNSNDPVCGGIGFVNSATANGQNGTYLNDYYTSANIDYDPSIQPAVSPDGTRVAFLVAGTVETAPFVNGTANPGVGLHVLGVTNGVADGPAVWTSATTLEWAGALYNPATASSTPGTFTNADVLSPTGVVGATFTPNITPTIPTTYGAKQAISPDGNWVAKEVANTSGVTYVNGLPVQPSGYSIVVSHLDGSDPSTIIINSGDSAFGGCGISWGGSPTAATPTAGFTWTGAGANTFNFSSTSTAVSPATIASYAWDFGDGTTSTTGPNVTHTYTSEAATRTVSLTVTDSSGNQATSTQTLGPDLVVSDAVSTPPSPAPGQQASLAVTVRNDGPATVTDVVPTTTFTEPTVSVGATSPASADLGPGASTTFTVPYTASALGPIHAQIAATGTTGANPVVATTVTRVITVVGAVTATLTPSTTSPVAGAQFTLDLHVTNTSGDTQDLSVGTPTGSPSTGVTITAPAGPIAPLANGTSTDLSYTATIAAPGAGSFTTPLAATDESTSVLTSLAPVATATAVPISIVVNSTADDALPSDAAAANVCDVDPNTPGDQCTLRAAIQLANLQTAAQSISFAIDGGGVPTIAPATALPTATVPLTIDGTTQSGGWVELSGASAPTGTGLSLTGGRSTVRGLVINGWATGISLTGEGGDLVAGNRIGTDTSGTSAVANGVGISLHVPDSTIGATTSSSPGVCSGDCNVISGSIVAGVSSADEDLPLPARSKIVGNFIGTDVTGRVALGNQFGIDLSAAFPDQQGGLASANRVLVGGPTSVPGTAPGNLISGNISVGVTGGNQKAQYMMTMEGNLVGATSDGSSALGNPDGIIDLSPGDIVGGPATDDGNIVGGSDTFGIEAAGLVEGNQVGVSIHGKVLKNLLGVTNAGSSSVALCGNTVSGNTTGLQGSFVLDSGNRVGTDPTGSKAVPNQIGIAPTSLTSGLDSRCPELGPDLVSGNTFAGVFDETPRGDAFINVGRIYVGTNSNGHYAIPNGVGFQLTGGTGGAELVNIGAKLTTLNDGIVGEDQDCDYPCAVVSGNNGPGINFGDITGTDAPTLKLTQTGIGVSTTGAALPNHGDGIHSDVRLFAGGSPRLSNTT